MALRLSKSRFAAGLQCPRRLWWTVHEPDAPELVPGPALAARFENGRRVGAVAREAAGEGVLIRFDRKTAPDDALRSTREALQGGARRIFEASFVHDDVFVAVDLLERRRDGWVVTEVKSSTKVKSEHVPDAAIQAWVASGAGLEVRRVELMHLNRQCRYPHLADLFVREDVTSDVEGFLPEVGGQVREQLAMLRGDLPEVEVGAHCDVPRACPFKDRCLPDLGSDHLSMLYRGGQRAWSLLEAGYETLGDLPEEVFLSAVQARQRRSVCGEGLVVDPGLAESLEAFERPVAYLDFETVSLPIPVWEDCRPYDQVPVQFVCCVRSPTGRIGYREHLAEGPADPREALAAALVDALEGTGTILAYYASFEQGCIEHLAEAVPRYRRRLHALAGRLGDLLPVVREHVYHPDFAGSFSIKAVLPALFPHLAYDDLEVAGGDVASAQLERLLFREDEMVPAERRALQDALRAYCKRDVEGLVELHRWLLDRAS